MPRQRRLRIERIADITSVTDCKIIFWSNILDQITSVFMVIEHSSHLRILKYGLKKKKNPGHKRHDLKCKNKIDPTLIIGENR